MPAGAPLRKVVLSLGPADRAYIRFAFSPSWECVSALRAWKDPSRHVLLLPWITRVRSAVAAMDWEPLASIAMAPRGAIPDFLAPPPDTALPELSDELKALRDAPPAVVRAEIEIAFGGRVPRELQTALEKPTQFLARLSELLEEFWRRALAPEWGLLRSRLEGEVLFRARALAMGGLDELFSEMHSDISYRDGHLTVHTDSYWDGKKRGRGVLLVPSIFSSPDVFLTVRPPWRPTIVFTARGIADLWSDSERTSAETLKLLLGASRAKVLVRLNRPQTTIEVARALALSPAAASEQITILFRAGVLERTRIGQRVFYTLNEKGKAVINALRP
jgi:DNA-binding transcriptional ArsR family regulator